MNDVSGAERGRPVSPLGYVAEVGEESSAIPVEATLEAVPLPAKFGSGAAIFFSISGRAGLLVLDSATGILCARLLHPSGRGELSAMILGPVFLAQTLTLGLPSALIYNIRKHQTDIGPLIGAAILLGAGMSVVATILGVAVLPSWLHLYTPELVRHAQWFMLASVFTMAAMIFRGVWESLGGFGKSAGAQLITRLGTLAGLGFFYATHRFDAYTAAISYVVWGSIPPFVWTCAAIVPKAKFQLRQMVVASRTLLSYGIRSYGIDLCGTLAQYVDQALVLGMLSASQMGSYTVALSLSRVLNVVSVSMAAVLFPKAIGEGEERVVRLAIRTWIGSLSLGLIGAALILFLGSFMLNLLYGHAYLTATTTLRILTLEALISGSLSVLSQPFMAQGRPGTVTLLQIAGLLAAIPLLLILVPLRGPEGASIALVCSALVRGILLCISYHYIFPGIFRWSMLPEESAVLARRIHAMIHKRLNGAGLSAKEV